MDVREALYTTRAMRRVKPDPIPMDVQARIMDAAVRAPSGGNTQNWRFLLVDDPAIKAQIGPIYRQAMSVLWATYYKDRIDAAHAAPDLAESKSMLRVQKSAQWLADNFETVPLFLFGFAQHDPGGEGVGTSLTQVLVFHNDEVFDILGIPKDEGWNMLGCVSLGYPTGKWGVAERQPAHDVSFRNQWGEDVGFRDPEPLWP